MIIIEDPEKIEYLKQFKKISDKENDQNPQEETKQISFYFGKVQKLIKINSKL